MAKITGAEYAVDVTVNKEGLRTQLTETKTMVKEAVREINATSNVALTSGGDVGGTTASSRRESAIATTMAKMKAQQADRQEESIIRAAARNRLGISTPQEQREIARFREQERQQGVRDDQLFREFIAARNARAAERGWNAGTAPREVGMSDLEAAAQAEARASRRMSAPETAAFMGRMRNLGIGALSGLYAADSMMRGANAQRFGFQDASDRYAFGGRNAFNDRIINSAASTQGMVAGMQSGPMGWMQYLPVVGAKLSESLERASRSADRMADSHQRATLSLQQTAISRASMRGAPLEALRLEQDVELKTKQAEFDKARRTLIDAETDRGNPAADAWFDLMNSGTTAQGERGKRINAARKVVGETQKDLEEKVRGMKDQAQLAIEMRTADLTSIRTRGGLAMAGGVAANMERQGFGPQAFALRLAIEERAERQRQMSEIAGKRGQEREEIAVMHKRERDASLAERRTRIFGYSMDMPEAAVMGITEGRGQAQVGAMRMRNARMLEGMMTRGLPDFGTVAPGDAAIITKLDEILQAIQKQGGPELPGQNVGNKMGNRN